MKIFIGFCKSQPVFVIAFLAAVATMFAVPPDSGYADYCNFSVLAELFALMIAVAGLRSVGLFEKMTFILLKKAGNVRRLARFLIIVCFFSSMLITNDVALITFVPLTILAFSGTDDERSRILTIVLETAAANLGSMMTPFGNPQNLYLFDRYDMTAMEFITTMLPVGAASLVCLMLLTLMIPKSDCGQKSEHHREISHKRLIVYIVLFLVCIAAVLKFIPFWICAVAAVIAALIFDRYLLLKADYILLLTFVCFFVFVGNIARIDAVRDFLSGILTGNEIIVSSLLSQGISNVPAAVMLSGFTENGAALLAGVNIGGLGTPIASMASLISLQLYKPTKNADSKRYLLWFSAINFGMLALLLAVFVPIMQR
ncbi:MAG: citrate transporter [Ruminiclostridium sp.]|nr:citrate transporter [Ruminiclostridium sp.]